MNYYESLWGAFDYVQNTEGVSRRNFINIPDRVKSELCTDMMYQASYALCSCQDSQLVEVTRRFSELAKNELTYIQVVPSVEKFLISNGYFQFTKNWEDEDIVHFLPAVTKNNVIIGDPVVVVPYASVLLMEEDPLRLMKDIVIAYSGVVHYHDTFSAGSRIDTETAIGYVYSLYSEYKRQIHALDRQEYISNEDKRKVVSLVDFYGEANGGDCASNLNPQVKINPPSNIDILDN